MNLCSLMQDGQLLAPFTAAQTEDVRVSVTRQRQHSSNRQLYSDLDPCSLTPGSSFWSLCFTWGLGPPLRAPPSGRQLEWLTGRASTSALVLAFWLLPALRTSSPSGAHATGMGRGIRMHAAALQGQTCRSPTETATWGEGMGMQGQGAGLRGLTMVSAQRWGQGRGPEVARSVCGERCQSRNPAHTAPPPGVSRKLPAGLSEGSPGVKRRCGWCCEVRRRRSPRPEPRYAGPSRRTHGSRRESSARPSRRSQHPVPRGRTHLPWEEVSGRAARRRHRVPAWLERLRAV